MQNIAARIETLENNLAALSGRLAQSMPGFIAAALYISSSEDPKSVFALAHYGGDENHIRRADREVWRRRLSPDESIAAELYDSVTPTSALSRMFPDEHICEHMPLTGENGQTGLLQTVFRKHKSPQDTGRLLTLDKSIIDKTSKSLNILLSGGALDDKALNVRPPYKPDTIVIYCDISGFVKSADMAHYRAQDFADKFCTSFVGNTAKRYKADILRYEGDGLWLALPFDADQPASTARAARQAAAMAQDMTQNYERFVRRTDRKFSNTNIKIMMELAELRTMTIPHSGTTDISGPSFTDITNNLSHARRDQNHVMVGPELAQIMPARKLVSTNPRSCYTDLISGK